MPDEDHGVEWPAVRLGNRWLGLDQGQLGDRSHLDPLRHALAFDVGADHVPVAHRDALGATGPQGLDHDQHLIGHQPTPTRIGRRVRGQAVAAIVDPGDPSMSVAMRTFTRVSLAGPLRFLREGAAQRLVEWLR